MDSLHRLNRIRLGFLPTPLVELHRLRKRLGGPRILMKRDDQTGLVFGDTRPENLSFFWAPTLHHS